MRAFNRGGQRLLSTKLNCLVDRQDHRLARVRLDLITLKGPPPSIPLKINFPRLAANLIVIVLLDAAQSNLIGSDKPEYVRRQRIVRIVTLRLFARIHAVEIQRVQLVGCLDVQAANDPGKLFVRVFRVAETFGQFSLVQSGCRRDAARGQVDVINLARISEKRFGVDTARQLTALAIEHLSPNRTGVDGRKLLVLGAGSELVVLADLNLD